ncbi:hypothetical protein M422DRAFT_200577 [Sphaerobolus stellatus SS14]|nr:hypothetical protein M422DRAFT_200577 [Sphaerobolus stellatus SS14]
MVLYSEEEWHTLLPAQLIQRNGCRVPDGPVFAYSPGAGELKFITWFEFASAVNAVKHTLTPTITEKSSKFNKPVVVGILANLDTVTYNALAWGIISAGGVAFLISTRNSAAAVSHLLLKTSCGIVITSKDPAIVQLANQALANDGHENVLKLDAPTFEDLLKGNHTPSEPSVPQAEDYDKPIMIGHSSGSTSHPKPCWRTSRMLLGWALNIDVPGEDMSKNRLAVHGVPMFHGLGFSLLIWAARTGMTLCVFPPQTPPITPSPGNCLTSAVATESTMIISVPFFVELWSRDAASTEHMKNLKAVIFGGGPLNKKIGDSLSRMGVRLLSLYGMAEGGPLSAIPIPPPGDLDWNWLNVNPRCDTRFIPQDDQGLFELVFVEAPTHLIAASNTEIDGKRALATNDLVIRHPTNPMRFRVYGRKDDQIMHSNGEKTNPGPIEIIVTRDSLVDYAVVFGRGRDQAGILVQPSKGKQFDPHDEIALAQYRNMIWPSIEVANEFSPAHSRIFKEMIVVTDPSKPMELTAKMTPRRQIVINAYEKDINEAYAAVEESSQLYAGNEKLEWNRDGILQFIRSIIHGVTNNGHIPDEEDLFAYGVDSLKATYIRNAILKVIRAKKSDLASLISQNFVYGHPTAASLTRAILDLSHGNLDKMESRTKELVKMERLVKEFSVDFAVHQPKDGYDQSNGEIVLVTGTTGGFGSYLLAFLATSVEVEHIYAVNRPSDTGKSLSDRQKEALTHRGLEPDIADLPKVTLLECDISQPRLGLNPDMYEKLRDSITLIIHNAWRVHFNMALDSFVPLIRGVRNLIDLSLCSPYTSPPRIIFASSIGIFRNWESLQRPLEIGVEKPEVSLGSGYAESKWISERILDNAAETTPLRPVIVRIGQLTSNASGAWNSTDWVPALVSSGQILDGLPSRRDKIAWISHEVAAAALFEFRTTSYRYLHLAHPNPIPWMEVFEVFSQVLNLPLITWSEWLERLRNDSSGAEKNPAIHLLDFYERASPVPLENRESLGMPLLTLTQALQSSSTLTKETAKKISRKDVIQWIFYWKQVGLLC